MSSFRARILVPILLVAAYLAAALYVSPRHGPTFDAVLGDYAYGEYFWEYWKSGDVSFLEFKEGRLDFLGRDHHPEWQLTYPLKWVYPVPSTLSAIGCDLFARRLHWLAPIDAHHLVAPLFTALLLFLLHRFVLARAGGLAATLGVGLLATHPHVFGHSINDIKDAPTLAIVFAALFAYIEVLERNSRPLFFLGAALTGFGLATKVNAIWPAAFFGLVFLISRRSELRTDAAFRRRWCGAIALGVVVVLGCYLFASPQYRVDGWQRFVEHWRYALLESTHAEGRDAFSIEPLRNLFFTAPWLYFPLAVVGIGVALRQKIFRPATFVLLALLGTIPALRPCMPGMRYFNLIRHFLEVLPVFSIFGGIGAAAIIRWLGAKWTRVDSPQRTWVTALLSISCVAPGAAAIARVTPYETTWFNSFAGGLAGAQRRGIADADDFWCQSCREAVGWLNEHAEKDAIVLDPFAPWMIGSLAKTELRPDLRFLGSDDAVKLLVDQGLLDPARDKTKWAAAPRVYVTYVPQTRRYNQKDGAKTAIMRFCESRLQPIHVVSADGGEIVRFYEIRTTE